MPEVHKTAIVSDKAEISENVVIGPYSIIGDNVIIEDGVEIGPAVLIEKNTRIGKNCKIFKGAVLGTDPQDLKFKGEDTYLEIGEETVIREYATLNRGTKETGKTVIGKKCFLMAYVHIAHDCVVGDGVILANNATLAGHVFIDDFAIIGGLTPVHQFVRIGTMSIVGGLSRVTQDVPPFVKAAGVPLRVYGLNDIGLRRRGIDREIKSELKKVYKIYYRSKKLKKDIKKEILDLDIRSHLARSMITFLFSSSIRGITPDFRTRIVK